MPADGSNASPMPISSAKLSYQRDLLNASPLLSEDYASRPATTPSPSAAVPTAAAAAAEAKAAAGGGVSGSGGGGGGGRSLSGMGGGGFVGSRTAAARYAHQMQSPESYKGGMFSP